MFCGWGVKAGMLPVWVADKTLWFTCYTWAISEHCKDKGLIYKALYKFICLIYLLTIAVVSLLNRCEGVHSLSFSGPSPAGCWWHRQSDGSWPQSASNHATWSSLDQVCSQLCFVFQTK